MKRLAILLMLLCSTACGQSPLDDASVFYRAADYAPTNTIIVNEGTRTEPLQLGPTLSTDGEDPVYVEDADGKHLVMASGKYATSAVPPATLNGSVTIALRYRPSGSLWNGRALLTVMDDTGQPAELKHFMLHQSTSNKYYSRSGELMRIGRSYQRFPQHQSAWDELTQLLSLRMRRPAHTGSTSTGRKKRKLSRLSADRTRFLQG